MYILDLCSTHVNISYAYRCLLEFCKALFDIYVRLIETGVYTRKYSILVACRYDILGGTKNTCICLVERTTLKIHTPHLFWLSFLQRTLYQWTEHLLHPFYQDQSSRPVLTPVWTQHPSLQLSHHGDSRGLETNHLINLLCSQIQLTWEETSTESILILALSS